MGHDQDNNHSHFAGNIKAAFFINVVFTIIEFIGGIFTNSLAIMSDALHDLGDSLALGLAWYFERLSGKNPDTTFTYGYRRFSTLGAVINAVILVSGSIIILWEAVPRMLNPESVNAKGMIIIAILGVIFNGIAVLKLKGSHSLNSRVVTLHLFEDVLGWIAILIGSIVIFFWDLPVIDPILSILISAYILFNVFRNLRESLRIFLQATPTDMDWSELSKRIESIDEICRVHDLQVWSMDREYHVMSVHVVVEKDYNLEEVHQIKQKVKDKIENEHIRHLTIEVENSDDECYNLDKH